MQKTRFIKLIDSLIFILNRLITDSWSKRSIMLLSLLLGFYFTNSFISFLLDKSVNTIFLAITILVFMEISIRSLFFSKLPKISEYKNLSPVSNFDCLVKFLDPFMFQ